MNATIRALYDAKKHEVEDTENRDAEKHKVEKNRNRCLPDSGFRFLSARDCRRFGCQGGKIFAIMRPAIGKRLENGIRPYRAMRRKE